MNTDLYQKAQKCPCLQAVGVKHEPLKLITPQFETPLPPLQVQLKLCKVVSTYIKVCYPLQAKHCTE